MEERPKTIIRSTVKALIPEQAPNELEFAEMVTERDEALAAKKDFEAAYATMLDTWHEINKRVSAADTALIGGIAAWAIENHVVDPEVEMFDHKIQKPHSQVGFSVFTEPVYDRTEMATWIRQHAPYLLEPKWSAVDSWLTNTLSYKAARLLAPIMPPAKLVRVVSPNKLNGSSSDEE